MSMKLAFQDIRFLHFGPFSAQIAPGTCVALTGPSGSGKSLLLRALADLDPHEGTKHLGSISADSVSGPRWRQSVGLLPSVTAWWHPTVAEHLPQAPATTLARVPHSPPDPQEALRDYLLQLGLTENTLDDDVDRLSSGEKQRLAILRLLLRRPAAMLLDEPTANLDEENTRKVEALLAQYRDETNAPVFWVTHDPSQAARVGDRRLHLADGVLRTETA